jgi:hypothetical protein
MTRLSALALALVALAPILPAAADAATVGTTAVYAPATSNAKGTAQIYRFPAQSSGTVDRLSVYLDGGSTASAVELGLYTRSASTAATRRAQCVIARPKADAWNRCSITAYAVTAGTRYWLALLQPAGSSGQLQYREAQVANGPTTYASRSRHLASLPASWTSRPSSAGGYQASLYADETGAATPTPTPTPRPSGFPDASNTGVQEGTTLSPYTGPSTISTPGTVVDGKTMGCIRVTAPGVTIRNSRISCADAYSVLSGDGDYSGTPLLVQDSEIDCNNTGGTALGEANIMAQRVNIHGCENGGDINQSFTIEDSYIHDLYNSPSAHTDGLQFAFGHIENGQVVAGSLNVTIKHNTIYGMGADGSFGTSAIISNRGADKNILIQGNKLAGGAVALYCEQGATGTNYQVLDNAFSRKFSQKIGYYGVSTDCSDETQSGNYDYETGQALRLP